MAYGGVIDDVRYATGYEKTTRLPVFLCSEPFDLRWYGKYTPEEIGRNGEKMAEVCLAAIEEFDYDWAWLHVDDFFDLEPLGLQTRAGENGPRQVIGSARLPATRETLSQLAVPDPWTAGRMPERLKAIEIIRTRLEERVMVTGTCSGPYTAACLLFGEEAIAQLRQHDRPLLAEICDFLAAVESEWVSAQVDAGAQTIWVDDRLANSRRLTPAQWRELALPACRKLTAEIRTTSALTYLHNEESALPSLEALRELYPDIINCGPGTDMTAAARAFRAKICFGGNLDPVLLQQGTAEQIAAEVERLVAIAYAEGGYIFCTGGLVTPDTPVQNMRALVAAIHRAGSVGWPG